MQALGSIPKSACLAASRTVIPLRACPAPFSRGGRRLVVQAAAPAGVGTVKIIIQGRRLPVTDAIRQYVEDKISKSVHHFQQEIKKIDVTLSARGGDTGTHGKRQQKVDVTIYTMKNGVVRVEDAEESLYASIDLVCDKVERKMRKVKELAISKGKWSGRAGPREDVQEQDYQEYMRDLIVEIKEFDEQQAREKELAALNVAVSDQLVRSKSIKLDPMSVDDAIDAMEAIGHDFFLFLEQSSDSVQVVYKRQSGGYGVLVPQK